jgi:hypothetical protein
MNAFQRMNTALMVNEAKQIFKVSRQTFVDADILEAERARIFGKCWLYLGHSSEVPKPGDFVTRQVGGRSILFARDERFWTQACNARVSDHTGDNALMRVNAIHHTIALVRAPKAGIQHINHQVENNGDVLRPHYFLSERCVPIVFGPGRHPTSGARFLYFTGPDGMVFEYSVSVDEIEVEATHRPRQFGFEPTSFCMWGSKHAGMNLPNA